MALRVFAPRPLVPGETLLLDAGESHYVLRVRRAKIGSALEVFDTAHDAFRAILVGSDRDGVRLQVGDRVPPPAPWPAIELFVGLPEPSAALEVVTKACELGVDTLTFIALARCQGAMPSPARIDKVVRAAQRQCGRAQPPRIEGPLGGLEPLLSTPEKGYVATLPEAHADAADRRSGLPEGPTRVIIGPEGGLTPAETASLFAAGYAPLVLGPYVLRTTTAVVAAVGLVRGCTSLRR